MARARTHRRKYDVVHVNLRERLLKVHRPGVTICWRCLLPIMESDTRLIVLGHNDLGTVVIGLEHRRCNNKGRMLYEAAKRKAARTGERLVELAPGIIGIAGTDLGEYRRKLAGAKSRVAPSPGPSWVTSPGRAW